MDEIITTCVQQQIRVFETHDEFRNDIQRFMRLAKIKDSHLVVFPELSGLLLAAPFAPGLKRTLLRVAERQVGKKPSFLDRMVGRAADSAADVLGGIAKSLTDAIIEHENAIRDAYFTTFSEIAHSYGMYIIGGSVYLPDASDGQMHNTAFLFSPEGEVIGRQSKINLGPADKALCQPGTHGLDVFETSFGKVGILIGQDVLYPETARILAAKGARFVANLLAVTSERDFLKARTLFSARVQENLIFGAQSCLVGRNILGESGSVYVGKSAILAPLEMTTRYSGKLGEVGTTVSESIISAAWDLKGLQELRDTTETPGDQLPENAMLQRQLRELYGAAEEAPATLPSASEEPFVLPGFDQEPLLPPAAPPVPEAVEEAPPLDEIVAEPSEEWGLPYAGDEPMPEPEASTAAPVPAAPDSDWTFVAEPLEPEEPEAATRGEPVTADDDRWRWTDEPSETEDILGPQRSALDAELTDATTTPIPAGDFSAVDTWWTETASAATDESGSVEPAVLDDNGAVEGTQVPAEDESTGGAQEWPAQDDTPGSDAQQYSRFDTLGVTGPSEPAVAEPDIDTAPPVGPAEASEDATGAAPASSPDVASPDAEDDDGHGSRFGRLRSWLGKREP